jgi:hypothetical protein
MKNQIIKLRAVLIITLTNLLISSSIFAQSPQKMSYQAVIRNSSNALVVSHVVGMRISILQGSATGTEVYSENQTPTTNANGLLSIEIGNGAGFATINWANGPYFIKTETDPTGGNNYTITGTSQLLSVPYSLNAKTAETADYNNLTNLPTLNIANWNTAYGWGNHAAAGYLTSYTETDPVFSAHLSSNITGADTSNWNHKYNLPALISGSVMFSNGATIAQDNNNLFWNNTNKRLGIGTKTPGVQLEIKNSSSNLANAILKVINNNGDSILTVTGNRTDICLDSATGSFNIYQLVSTQKKQLFRINPSNCFIGYKSGINNGAGNNNFFAGNEAGVSNTTGNNNTFIGYQSGFLNQGGFDNVYLGYQSGYTSGTDGTNPNYRNVFIGPYSGYSSRGITESVFIGYDAGRKNTTGSNNTFIGGNAGSSNILGSDNVYLGNSAGNKSNKACYNTYIGSSAGATDTCGYRNVYIGERAGTFMPTGYSNTFIGSWSGRNKTRGDYNTFLGYATGDNNGVGSGNVFIGFNVGANETGSNLLYIDNSNTVEPLIWGTFTTNKVVINGNAASNINNRTFFVQGSAGGTGAWWNDSDEKLKKNIKTIDDPLKKVLALRGVNYEWKDTTNHEKGLQIGFIAQEVIKILPEVVANNGGTYSMQYAPINALLVEAIKAQQKKIESLESLNDKVKQLEEQNKKLENDLKLIKEQLKMKNN